MPNGPSERRHQRRDRNHGWHDGYRYGFYWGDYDCYFPYSRGQHSNPPIFDSMEDYENGFIEGWDRGYEDGWNRDCRGH